MGIWSTIGSVALNLARAGLQAATGTAAPGAPAATATIATVAGTSITFGQLVSTAKTLEGSTLAAELNRLITNIGDVDNDLDVTQHVAALLAPYVPAAGGIAVAAYVLKLGWDGAQVLYATNPAAFAPAPRSGPPIAEADWSHGWPKPKPVDNPSGAIGG